MPRSAGDSSLVLAVGLSAIGLLCAIQIVEAKVAAVIHVNINTRTFFMTNLIFGRKIAGEQSWPPTASRAAATRVSYSGQMPPGCPVQPACPGPMCTLLRPLLAGITYGKELLKPSVFVLTPSPRGNPNFVESTRMPSIARREMSNTSSIGLRPLG